MPKKDNLNVTPKQAITTTGISITESQMEKLNDLATYYHAKRSPVVGSMIDQEYDRLVEAGEIDA